MRRKIAAGNWKMHGTGASLAELQALCSATRTDDNTDILICPPATLLTRAVEAAARSHVLIGAQDCHSAETGAHTGDISAEMIADAGASHVIVGHSERRDAHGETDSEIRAKAAAAYRAGLIAIICIGESEAERASGKTLEILAAELDGSCPENARSSNTIIAYEPIWAIGTGKTPSLEQIVEVHDFLRDQLVKRFGADGQEFSVLYGGSVKPENADTIFRADNVDGALVGGASLKASDFAPIAAALQKS